MFSFYFIINWAPRWVTDLGLSTAAGIGYSIYVSIGGIFGGLVAGWVAGRVGVKRLMLVTMFGMAAMIVLFGVLPAVPLLLLANGVALGAMLFASACGCWLTIAYAFPPQLRATGLGIATTAGRIGSIFGPATAGYLMVAGSWTNRSSRCCSPCPPLLPRSSSLRRGALESAVRTPYIR